MSNMRYCMFENTYRDLLDCQQDLDDARVLSESETKYANLLIALCQEILDEHG